MAKTKLCKYCKSQIDKKASICPHCQKKQSGIGDAFKCVIAAIALIIFVPLFVSACNGVKKGYKDAEKKASVEVATTAEKSVSIQTGTTDSTEAVTVEDEPTEEVTEAETAEAINQVVYNDNNIKVTYTGIEETSRKVEIKLLIENNTNYTCAVQNRNLSVNGYMISGSMNAVVSSQKKCNDSLSIYKSSLEENKIENIENIEFNLHFFNWDDWTQNNIDSDVISINITE